MTQRDLEGFTTIFDLDGCISDDEWRLSMIDESLPIPDRFKKYHDAMKDDVALPIGVDMLMRAWIRGSDIAFITARPESHRGMTNAWLRNNISPKIEGGFSYKLLMRKEYEEGISSVVLKKKHLEWLVKEGHRFHRAYDDRQDVVKMYQSFGIDAWLMNKHEVRKLTDGELTTGGHIVAESYAKSDTQDKTAADFLESAASIFRERNAVYKDSYKLVGDIMAVLFPNGVRLRTKEDHQFYHLFELLIVKLTRFSTSGLKHSDSIADLGVYAAMLQPLLESHNIQFNKE